MFHSTPSPLLGIRTLHWLARFAWVMLCALFAGVTLASPTLVPLDGQHEDYSLSRSLQTLEDSGSRFDIKALISQPQPWADHHDNSLSFGYSRSAWWVRVGLVNTTPKILAWILDVGTPLQDQVDLYVVRGQGTGQAVAEHVAVGDRQAYEGRPMHTRIPSMVIRFAPGETLHLYVRLATHDGLHEAVGLKLWRPDAYASATQAETLTLGLYYGALGTVLLYNLFLFLSTRERSFGIYVVYVTAFLVWSFTFRGYAFQYWWPGFPVFNNQVLPVAAAACYVTFGWFATSYLETRARLPLWLHRTLLVAIGGNALSMVPAFFNHYTLSFALSTPFGVILMISALLAGIRLLMAGSRPARYLVIAFTLLAVGVVLYYLRVLGVVPSNMVTDNFLQIGSALEVLLLALGLADQMNTLKADKLHAERTALMAQTALNNELESLVLQRTSALEEANERLANMAITDELTGAYNRRHFNTAFEAELSRHGRHQTPMAFCMLDIDNFKLYNDVYGHQAGDVVLQRLSAAVRQQLRRAGDQFFRLGGEEFGILLNANEPIERATSFIERIRADIEKLGIAHSGNPYKVVTASFGLVLIAGNSPQLKVEEVYAEADKLLYEAKHGGRNRVISQNL